jgi:hypothetical protein
MEKINERRREQRLLYRWPVRFFTDNTKEAFPAQIFDLSSASMTFLCDSDESCPQKEQQISVSFSVPYFNHNNSFDTVFFERIGTIRRVDKMADRVNRVAIGFVEPLFFKPGEQEIDQADAQSRLQEQAISIIKAEEKARACSRALAQAEEQTRFFAQAKAKLEQMLHTEIENRAKFEADIRLKTQQEIIGHIETAAKAQELAKTEAQARVLAEQEVQKGITAREKAEKSLDARAEKIAKQLIREKASSYNEQILKLKADFEDTIASITEQVEQTILQIEAQYKATGYNKSAIKEVRNHKKVLMKKLDRFITDTNRIF